MSRYFALAVALGVGFFVGAWRADDAEFICPKGTAPMWTDEGSFEFLPEVEIRNVACTKPDGTRHGPVVRWMDDFLWTVGYFSEGQLNGASFEFLEGHRKNGVADWVRGELRDYTRWNAAGIMTGDERHSGAGRSVIRIWYDSGALKHQIEKSAGEFDGNSESWYESGTLRARGRYHSGKRVGTWMCWNEQNERNFSVTFDEIGTMVDWSSSPSTIEDWMRSCVKGCPGERLEDLASADPDRRCESETVEATGHLQLPT